jgi:hypothetical protein
MPFEQQLAAIERLGCLERLPARHAPVADAEQGATRRHATGR